MTTNMPTEDHAPYSDRGWSFGLRPGGASLLNRGRLRLGILIQETSQALVDGYNGIQDATTRYIYHAATGAATPAEIVDLESQPVNQQEGTETVREPDTTPRHTVYYQTNLFTPETDEPENAGQLATPRVDNSGDGTAPSHSRRSWTWVVRLTVVLLLLITAPGLIIGIVTRKVAWGIAISGTFAPAVVFLGGLCYHHNR